VITSGKNDTSKSSSWKILETVLSHLKGPGKRGHIVAHDASWAAQTGKHLLPTQNVSEQNQEQFLRPGRKICVGNKCCARARGQTGKHLCL